MSKLLSFVAAFLLVADSTAAAARSIRRSPRPLRIACRRPRVAGCDPT